MLKIIGIILLVIVAVVAIGITVVVMKIRRVVKEKGAPLLAQGRIMGLEAGLEEIKKRAAKPENAGNAEIADLQQRVESALAQCKTALESKDYAKVAQVADPILGELLKHAERIAEEARLAQEAEAARQAANAGGKVIDGEFTEVKEPAALLPAPDATTANPATGDAAENTGVMPPVAADKTGTEGDGTKK